MRFNTQELLGMSSEKIGDLVAELVQSDCDDCRRQKSWPKDLAQPKACDGCEVNIVIDLPSGRP